MRCGGGELAPIFGGWRRKLKSSAVVGKPVFLEEDGERIGVVRDVKFDDRGEAVEYLIDIDGKVTGIPKDSVMERADGIVIEPLWFIDAKRFIRDLEVEARRLAVDSDLILKAGPMKRAEMLRLLSQKADVAPMIEKAAIVQKVLLDRLHMFQEEKNKIGLDLITLEQKRIMEEIDRREFLHALIDLRRKAKIAGVMIENCVVLLQKMNELPFVPSEVDIDLVSAQSFLASSGRQGSRETGAAMASGGMAYPYSTFQGPQQPQVPQGGGKVQGQGGEDAEDRAKRIRKVRVLKVEKELEDIKKQLGTYGAGGGGNEESIRTKVELAIKRDRLKEVNQEIPAIEKLLKSPDLTPAMREYFQVRKDILDRSKDSLGRDVKEMNAKLSSIEKGGGLSADGGRDLGLLTESSPISGSICLFCGKELPIGETRCGDCGYRPAPRSKARKTSGREVAVAKLGMGMLFAGLFTLLIGVTVYVMS
ncbi:MAG TPA: PRC-barrel domain-containing protein [Thermoplasmata archaeon]|nr:PRC-barrel domain-containing protein [Thermoplasmata archaeon]